MAKEIKTLDQDYLKASRLLNVLLGETTEANLTVNDQIGIVPKALLGQGLSNRFAYVAAGAIKYPLLTSDIDADDTFTSNLNMLADRAAIKTFVEAQVSSGITLDSGLTKTGNVGQLGGSLIQTTRIESNGQEFRVGETTATQAYGTLLLNVVQAGLSQTSVASGNSTISTFVNSVSLLKTLGTKKTNIELTDNAINILQQSANAPSDAQSINLSTSAGMLVTDQNNEKGFVYGNAYEANFTDRSLISKLYADTKIGGNNVNALITSPSGQLNKVIGWDNNAGEYTLVDKSSGSGGTIFFTDGIIVNPEELSTVQISGNSTITSTLSGGIFTLGVGTSVLTETSTNTVHNKSISISNGNSIAGLTNDSIAALAGIDATKIATGAVDNVEFLWLDGVTSSIQDQLDSKLSGTQLTTHAGLIDTHGVAVEIVGTTDFQELTNKTIVATSNTISAIDNTHLSASAGVLMTQLETLTVDRLPVIGATGFLEASTVTAEQVGWLSTLPKDIETYFQEKLNANLKGAIDGVAELDGNGKVPASQLPNSGALTYQGVWNATTNVPVLSTAGVGGVTVPSGYFYVVETAGTISLDGGLTTPTWNVGDYAIYDDVNDVWDKVAQTSSVVSVHGRGGAVIGASGDYTAQQITFVPTATLTPLNVQDAITTLETRIATNISGAISTVATTNLTADRVVVSTGGKLTASGISTTLLNFLSGMTGSTIQLQINSKLSATHESATVSVHGMIPGSIVVGTTMPQTLTQKELVEATLTGPTQIDGTITGTGFSSSTNWVSTADDLKLTNRAAIKSYVTTAIAGVGGSATLTIIGDTGANTTVDTSSQSLTLTGGLGIDTESGGTQTFTIKVNSSVALLGVDQVFTGAKTFNATTTFDGNLAGTSIDDDNTLTANSATKVATQQAVKGYVTNQINAVNIDVIADSGANISLGTGSFLTIAGGDGITTSNLGTTTTLAVDNTVIRTTTAQTLDSKTLTNLSIDSLNTGDLGPAIQTVMPGVPDNATLLTSQAIANYVTSQTSGSAPGTTGDVIINGGNGSYDTEGGNLRWNTGTNILEVGGALAGSRTLLNATNSSGDGVTLGASNDGGAISVKKSDTKNVAVLDADGFVNGRLRLYKAIGTQTLAGTFGIDNATLHTTFTPAANYGLAVINSGTMETNQANGFVLYSADYGANNASPFVRTENNTVLNLAKNAARRKELKFFPNPADAYDIVQLIGNTTTILNVSFNTAEIDSVSYSVRKAGTTGWTFMANIDAINTWAEVGGVGGLGTTDTWYVRAVATFDVAWVQEAFATLEYLDA